MKSYISLVTSFHIIFAGAVFAGTGLGDGGAGKQLQEAALSETILSTTRMEEILGNNPKLDLENIRKDIRSTRLMESSSNAPAGILLDVQPTDFDQATALAAEGKEFVYREMSVRAMGIDRESKIVTMTLVEDSSLTIVVKDAENK